uniref:Replication protein A 70 kDa DNA-binding subunit C-like n=1 Tax=Tanacetum cinerariifolium TaxID=118510 RepID=A0A6L2JUD3_TANCI|nr:replication protein A 70 kDa DNA-binding subunit C-like [Tanacetum cinerariifolium]
MFMLEFDGETTTRKVSADPLDVAGYVTKVGRTTYTKSGSKTLDFYLANKRDQSLRVTLWGGLSDVLVERKTKHVGMCAMVLTAMSAKDYNRYLQKFCVYRQQPSTVRYKLEVVVANDTAHTIVVMFNDTARKLLKCSAESLMGMDDKKADADDDSNFPNAIRNLIGSTYVLEI